MTKPLLGAMLALALAVIATTPALASYPGQDGRIAFAIDPGSRNVDIYSTLPGGQDLRRLTDSPGFDACPAYSPDGKQIAYCHSDAGVSEIWTMTHNGHRQRQLTDLGGSATFPDYAPDGEQIAFTARAPGAANFAIYTTDTSGEDLVRLTDEPGNDLFPVYSPDGTRIAFISDRTGTQQVWVMNADGTNPHQLTFDPARKDQLPDWSPDGTRIAYQSFATGNGDLYVMDADGTQQTRLTSDPGTEIGAAWSPDGRRIAYLQVEGRLEGPTERTVMTIAADGTDPTPVHPLGAQFVPAWQPLGNRAHLRR